ncbi:ferritin-like domain-containing protein [Aridibaculum aurantiacum]|uniref:YciE/YciF ferroxidase family protein n=1 Tax=Aridibaculum aurantiacum TaxID=2810307 RepID=UPI001F61C945|nr:ferritin-like domain-containing protein [Aridibaculum aurantiacum]
MDSKKIAGKNAGAGAANSLLKEFFVDELKDIYYAEKQIAKTLPKMKKAATSDELKNAFESHLTMTEQQIERLEKVFELLGEKAKGKTCEAIEGIIKEGEGIISDTDSNTATRDVGLIFAAQKVEHYEIATYGGLAQLAETLGLTEAQQLLHTTLEEEKQTDLLLTGIAESHVNYEASEEKA